MAELINVEHGERVKKRRAPEIVLKEKILCDGKEAMKVRL